MSPHLLIVLLPLAALAQSEGSLSLSEALRVARENGPDARVVLERAAQAEARADQAGARLLPYLGLRAGYDATNHAGRGFGMILGQRSFDPTLDFNRPGTLDSLSLGVELRHRLFASGADLASASSANRAAEASRAHGRSELRALDLAVAEALERVRVADAAIEAARLAAAAASQALANAERREAAGTLLRSERLRVAAERARADDALRLARLARADAAGTLQIFLGRDPAAPLTLAAPEPLVSADTLPPETTVPELLAAAAGRAAAEEAVRAARRAHGPTVDLVAEWGSERGYRREGEAEAWTAGVVVRLPLFEGGAVSARVREAVSARRAAEAAESKAAALAAHRLALARQALAIQRDRELAARMNLEQAEEAARLSLLRFEAGQLLATEWAAAESALAEARLRMAASAAAHRLAALTLRVALGGDLLDELSR